MTTEVVFREHLKRICKASSLRYPEDHEMVSGLIKKRDLLAVPPHHYGSARGSAPASTAAVQRVTVKTLKGSAVSVDLPETTDTLYKAVSEAIAASGPVRILRQGRVIPEGPEHRVSQYIPDPSVPLHVMEVPAGGASQQDAGQLPPAFFKDLRSLLGKHGVNDARAAKLASGFEANYANW